MTTCTEIDKTEALAKEDCAQIRWKKDESTSSAGIFIAKHLD